ncbi:phosphoribosylamine-glycine ligase [Aequitasia blattaphilus]|uniref:ATP-grasp domain-containing protein n=1 Tax=Aequitasia blattaphilus TaxID=2949332 RepID=A0ABT1E5Y6_9FIRM|nr:ATP-grasp domain-containing protein [Aequitasia blattaphilus]MCP1101254.1 ATP-grasp domain-containing protein [Aequitasia blattaphilus]MCR8613894.1 ATP-grasp domain-containing protein [Aequitasia blattaphilus]
MKKIMILGAGIYQVQLIKKVNELGMQSIVCSIPGNYPGFKDAHKSYYVDTRDSDQIIEIASKEKIDGICTSGTDVAVSTIGKVCDALSLCGITYRAAQKATDKKMMKKAFLENGVETAEFRVVSSAAEAEDAFFALNSNVIMKVTDKSGSRGIVQIKEYDKVKETYERLIQETEKDYLVVEEFIKGHEIGIDAIVQNKKVIMMAPHDKITYNYMGTGIPIGHVFPYLSNDVLNSQIHEQVKKVISALELDNCAVNMDVFITDDGQIKIIEAGARAGATGIPELLSLFYDIDFYKCIIQIALGEKLELEMKPKGFCASRLLFSEFGGVLNNVEIMKGMDKIKIDLDISKGDRVEAFSNGTCRFGQALICESSQENVNDFVENFNQYIRCDIGDGNG